MTEKELVVKLEEQKLGRYFEVIKPFFKSTVKLHLLPAPENDMKTGQTRIGGQPDLPESFSWPNETTRGVSTRNKFQPGNEVVETTVTKPLSFVAQINFSELAGSDPSSLLPETGILYFFYCSGQEAWGFDIADGEKFKVIYFDGNLQELKRHDFPSDLEAVGRFKPCLVEAREEISLPPYGHAVYDHMTEDEQTLFYEHIYETDKLNKMLGYSDNIQYEMEQECELITKGFYLSDVSAYNDQEAKRLEANAADWRLLLQLESNSECSMMWGDTGRLYFWIKEKDLRARDFDKCWMCLQC